MPIAFCFACVATHGADIVLREEVAAPGSIVRLGDVARIVADSELEQRRLSAMPLMPSPPPGQERRLRLQSVRDLMQAQGEDLSRHRFVGAAVVRIADVGLTRQTAEGIADTISNALAPTPETTPRQSTGFRTNDRQVSSLQSVWSRPLGTRGRRAIEQGIEEAVDRWLESQGRVADILERGEITIADEAFNKLREIEPDEFRVRLLTSEGTISAGEHRFGVTPPRGGYLNEPEVVVELVERQYAVVALQQLRRGDLLTASRVALRALPRGERVEGAYVIVDDVLGLEASRSIREGAALTRDTCIGPLLVRRGDTVTVVSGGGGVSVRISAVAKEDGREGDLVSLEAFDRSEQLEARVVGRGRLAVVSIPGAGVYQSESFATGRNR